MDIYVYTYITMKLRVHREFSRAAFLGAVNTLNKRASKVTKSSS